jgi:hypothetical protein
MDHFFNKYRQDFSIELIVTLDSDCESGVKLSPKNDDEKWSRKNYFEIPPCAKPFLENLFYFIERGIFASNCKFSNKNGLLCAWRDFSKTFCGISTYYK